MTLAVASGKGGTGKTMVATSLAALLARDLPVTLLDLDVEEPNAHLFLRGPLIERRPITNMLPVVKEEFCTHCGLCQRICAYHALLVLPEQVMVFPELCKSCNGCVALCPEGAIVAGQKEIGTVELRESGQLRIRSGRLRIGSTDAPALIRAVKGFARHTDRTVVIDAPPGAGCPAVEAVRDADFTVLVAESTPFGLHDLDLMVQTVRQLGRRHAVVINKAVPHDSSIREYCAREAIDVLAEIPYREDIARSCARGALLPEALPDTIPFFESLLTAVRVPEEEGA